MAGFRPCTFCLAVQSQTVCSCLSSARCMLATSIRWIRTSQTRCSSLWSQDFGNKGSWISVSSRPAWLCSETIFQKQPTPCGGHSSSGVAHALSAHLLPFTLPVWWAEAPLFKFCLDEHYLCSLAWGWGSIGLGMGRELRERQALNPDWLGTVSLLWSVRNQFQSSEFVF